MNDIGDMIKKGWNILNPSESTSDEKMSYEKLQNPPIKYHIHLGAGKLGIGLVIPKFKHNKLIIIQRPSLEWKALLNSSILTLSINSINYFDISVIHQNSIEFLNKLNVKLINGESIFICTDNIDIIHHVMKSASSISTSLGDGLKDFEDILLNLKSNLKVINIFPFENDTSIIDSIKSKLEDMNSVLNVVPTIADKICRSRLISNTNINIEAEEFEEVFLLANNENIYGDIDNNKITIVKDPKLYDFYYNRKLYIVNGVHMIAVILGHGFLDTKKVPFNERGSYHLSVLMGIEEIKYNLIVFIKIQCLRLIIENDVKIFTELYNSNDIIKIYSELLNYGNSILNRFDFSLDQLERILRIDLNKIEIFQRKLEERIFKIVDFTQRNKDSISENISKIKNIDIEYTSLLEAIIKLQSDVSRVLIDISSMRHERLRNL